MRSAARPALLVLASALAAPAGAEVVLTEKAALERVFPGETPELRIYDTTVRGQADVNDRTRDIDQLDLLESVDSLGQGLRRFGSSDVPRYRSLLEFVCSSLGFDGERLRGYRVASEYPIYGSQFALALRTTDLRGLRVEIVFCGLCGLCVQSLVAARWSLRRSPTGRHSKDLSRSSNRASHLSRLL